MFHVERSFFVIMLYINFSLCYNRFRIKLKGVVKLGKIIAITNQKGGVGKTTTAVNLAAAVGNRNKKVLLIDMDPQGNTTSGVGIDKRAVKASIYGVLEKRTKIEDAIIKTEFKNLSVIPSNASLSGAELELVNAEDREYYLKETITPIMDKFDYIFFDCPPSLGMITTNVLCASNSVIVPIQCEFYALEGLSQLIGTIRRIKRQYNNHLKLEGVLLTMFDKRLNLTLQVVDEVKNYFRGQVFNTVIPRTVRLSEAPSFGKPVMYFDKFCKGSRAYNDLAKELIKNNKK